MKNNIYSSTDEISAPLCKAPGHQDPGVDMKNPKGLDFEESIGIPDKVSGIGLLDCPWY